MTPNLSIVTVGKNDDHGMPYSVLDRLKNFLDSIDPGVEIVIVEWNPPSDRPQFREFPWIKERATVYTVPHEIHIRYPNHDRLSLFEMIAKNVGIRRATRDWILSTNLDIMFSREIMRRIQEPLDQNCYYRADRRDMDKPIPTNLPLDEKLRLCEQSVFLLQYRDGEGWEQPDGKPAPHYNASGDFMLMTRDNWHAQQGYPEWVTQGQLDSYGVYMARRRGLEQVTLDERMYHQIHVPCTEGRPITPWNPEKLLPPDPVNGDNWGLADQIL